MRPRHITAVCARPAELVCAIRGEGDPRLGKPICPACYDHAAHVAFNWHAPELWRRFTVALRRTLAQQAGLFASQFSQRCRVSFVKVVEFQRRGVVHFPVLIRLDGPGDFEPPRTPSMPRAHFGDPAGRCPCAADRRDTRWQWAGAAVRGAVRHPERQRWFNRAADPASASSRSPISPRPSCMRVISPTPPLRNQRRWPTPPHPVPHWRRPTARLPYRRRPPPRPSALRVLDEHPTPISLNHHRDLHGSRRTAPRSVLDHPAESRTIHHFRPATPRHLALSAEGALTSGDRP